MLTKHVLVFHVCPQIEKYICKIVRRAREALTTWLVKQSLKTQPQFLPENLSFLLNKSGDDNTALLLIDGTYMYIYMKKVENTRFIGNHSACTRGGLSLSPCLLLHLTGLSLISWVLIWQTAKTTMPLYWTSISQRNSAIIF